MFLNTKQANEMWNVNVFIHWMDEWANWNQPRYSDGWINQLISSADPSMAISSICGAGEKSGMN